MATYYINADTGNDSTGDGSSGSPWLTLAHAYDNSTTDDTIHFQNSSASFAWVTDTINYRTLTATTLGDATLDGSAAIVKMSSTNITVENLIFTNATVNTGTGNPMIFLGGTNSFTNCIMHTLTINGSSGPDHSGIWGNNGSIYTLTLEKVLVYNITKNSTLSQSALFGSRNNAGTTTTFTINNCTFYLDGDEFTYFFTPYNTQVRTMTNNIVFCHTSTINFGLTGATVTSNTNCWYNMTGTTPSGTGDITSDPLFVDADNNDFHLRPTSPCRNTGTLL